MKATLKQLRDEHAEQLERMRIWLGVLRHNADSATEDWAEVSGIQDVIDGLEISITKTELLLG